MVFLLTTVTNLPFLEMHFSQLHKNRLLSFIWLYQKQAHLTWELTFIMQFWLSFPIILKARDLDILFSTSEAFFCFALIPFLFCNELLCVTGGRFKKEIVVDGQSYLLLIRDEGGPPEAQVSIAHGASSWLPVSSVAISYKRACFTLSFSVSCSFFCC